MTQILSPGAQRLALPETPPHPPPPSAPRPDLPPRSLLSLFEVSAIVVIAGALAALLLPPTCHRPSLHTRCATNLKQLWVMHENYRMQFGGRKLLPSDTGAGFWTLLTKTSPPLIDASLGDIYDCPISPGLGGIDNCEYRGPASDVNAYADTDPVGACDHGDAGIVVIRKSGDAMLYARADPVAVSALEKTRP